MRSVRALSLSAAFIALALTTRAATAQTSYKRDLPDSLRAQAKVAEDAAAKTALAKVPKGAIQSVELERENGKLQYSYDIKIAGKKGIEEVNVDAITGKVIGGVEHENPATEKKEAAADAKNAKTTTVPKKP